MNKHIKYIKFLKQKGMKTISRRSLKEFDEKIFNKVILIMDKYEKDKFSKCAWAILNSVDVPCCKTCGEEVEMFTFLKGPRSFCSQPCLAKSEEYRNKLSKIYHAKSSKEKLKRQVKIKNTCLKKYGGVAPACNKKVRIKMQKTTFEIYGVKNAASSPEVYSKIVNTNLIKYGGHPNRNKKVRKKYKKTCMSKYGVDHVSKTEAYKLKFRETNLKRYGTTHYMKNPEQYEKFSKSIRSNFKHTINGKTYIVRGYEHFALDYLSKRVNLKHIVNKVSKGLPTFIYKKDKRYYPDFYNKKKNEVIEVKSDYTAGLYHKNLFKILRSKAKSVVKRGYKFKVLVFDKQGTLILKLKDIHRLSYSKFKDRFYYAN